MAVLLKSGRRPYPPERRHRYRWCRWRRLRRPAWLCRRTQLNSRNHRWVSGDPGSWLAVSSMSAACAGTLLRSVCTANGVSGTRSSCNSAYVQRLRCQPCTPSSSEMNAQCDIPRRSSWPYLTICWLPSTWRPACAGWDDPVDGETQLGCQRVLAASLTTLSRSPPGTCTWHDTTRHVWQ